MFSPDSKTTEASRMTMNLFNIELLERSLGMFGSIDSRHREALSLAFRFRLCFLTFGLILRCALFARNHTPGTISCQAQRAFVSKLFRNVPFVTSLEVSLFSFRFS